MKIIKINEDLEPILLSNRQPDEIEFDSGWIRREKGLPAEAIEFAEFFGRFLADSQKIDDNKNPGQKKIVARKNGLTTSQIRNFFGEVKKIQMKGLDASGSDFVMLKPRLAIAKTRALKDNDNINNRFHDFSKVMNLLIDEVNKVVAININKEEAEKKYQNDRVFKNFVDFFEAVVAYHKVNGGKN